MSVGYDYTREDVQNFDDIEMPETGAAAQSAEEIAATSGFREVPVGLHEFVVLGLFEAPKDLRMDYYVNGQRAPLNVQGIKVKYALASDPGAQIIENFWWPPSDPAMNRTYWEGTSKPDGKAGAKGLMARKLFAFLDKIGFPCPKGGTLTAEARKPGNWKGRHFVAEVKAGDDYYDQTTGQTKQGRNQIALFSYQRAPGGPVQNGQVHAVAGQSTQMATPQPARQQAQPARKPQIDI